MKKKNDLKLNKSGSTPDLATQKRLKINNLSLNKVETRPKRRPNPKPCLHAEFKQLKSQQMHSFITPYKPAALYTGKNYWYIYYYYLDPLTGRFERFKEYFDINRIGNKKERRLYGQEAVKFINQKLIMGFNPFKQIAVQQQGGTIIDKLDFIYNDLMKHANDGMKADYSTQLNRFKKIFGRKKISALAINYINIALTEEFKSWMQDRQLSKNQSTLIFLASVLFGNVA